MKLAWPAAAVGISILLLVIPRSNSDMTMDKSGVYSQSLTQKGGSK